MKINVHKLIYGLAEELSLDPFTVRYCVRRFDNEGIEFLTVTLPKISKSLLRSFELGKFDRTDLTNFAWKGGLLKVFRGFLLKIFKTNGDLLEDPDALAIYSIRQFCEYFYKLALPFDEEVLEEFEDKFVKTDLSLDTAPICHEFVDLLRKDFETHMPKVAYTTVHEIFSHSPPRPASGTYSGKADNSEWFMRQHRDERYPRNFKPYSGYFRYMNLRKPEVCLDDPEYTEVLFVPKDSRGPRVISREPFSKLKAQMAFFDYITCMLEKHTYGRVMFRDQQQNRMLAEQSSRSRDWATIDMKDASDRVSYKVVRHLFRYSPMLKLIEKSRCSYAKLPSGKFHSLRKLSGMGSGFTFPIMSLLLYLTSVRAIVSHSRLDWRQASKLVYTFGDDVIVPNQYYSVVVAAFQKVGMLVNESKSFTKGFFRESCGGDFYNGQNVTPIRLKLSNAELTCSGKFLFVKGEFSLLALERHCRELVTAGLLQVAEVLYSSIERKYGPLPTVSGDSHVIGRYTLQRDIVLKNLTCDGNGNYNLVRVLVPKARFARSPWFNHSIVIGRWLRWFSGRTWQQMLFPGGSASSEFSIPRRMGYARVKIPGIALS